MTPIQEAVEQKQAVIFDLFHTLTAKESRQKHSVPSTCEMLGVSREAWREQLFGHSRERLAGEERDPIRIVTKMARAIDPSISDEIIEATVANRIRRFEITLRDIPDETRAVLRHLKSQGKKLGLVSNADAMEVAAWDKSPIADIFDTAVLSCCVGAVKPERRIYEICLDRLGVTADEAIFVGDGGSDELRGAKAMGLTTVIMVGVVKELWPDKIEERKADADFVIECLSELVGGH